MTLKTQILIYLILIGAIDVVIPIPITALILIYVLFQKPVWFKQWVDEIFQRGL
jgi:uncharacterized membrane protein